MAVDTYKQRGEFLVRITKKLLEEKEACAEWLACFNATFPDGIDLKDWTAEKQIEVLKSDLRKYIGWAFARGIIPLWSMQGANLEGAYLGGANLGGAYLEGANLEGANLEGAYLGGARYDEYTVFPLGFDAKGKGAWLVE